MPTDEPERPRARHWLWRFVSRRAHDFDEICDHIKDIPDCLKCVLLLGAVANFVVFAGNILLWAFVVALSFFG